jgi:hypothetical protein
MPRGGTFRADDASIKKANETGGATVKKKIVAGSIIAAAAAIAVVAVVALGTGGDGDKGGESQIRTQKGLAVAAAGNFGNNGAESDGAALPASGSDVVPGGTGAASGGGDVSVSVGVQPVDAKGGYGYPSAPVLQQGGGGITVQGYGSATAAADSAVAEFYFSSSGFVEPKPVPYPDIEPPYTPTEPGEAEPITEESLQAVIDAIVAAGVPEGDIEFIGQSYPDPYYSSATLRATVSDIDSLDAVVEAAQDAASGLEGIMLNSTNVAYTISDCMALETAAMEAAVEDAAERGAAFAEALGVGLGAVTGASHYSYAAYGSGGCGETFYGGPYYGGGMGYFEGQASEVMVFASISVTYAIE